MVYALTFLEGILAFISPCVLPLVPVYITFIAGARTDSKPNAVIHNALGFIAGFSAVFLLMGSAAATFGMFVRTHMSIINIVGGIMVILFGVHFTGLLDIPFLNFTRGREVTRKPTGFFSAALFGIIFSVGWTPCVSAYLGAALMSAANSGTMLEGILLLAAFSIGLGLPFLLSAIFMNELHGAFGFIKKNYKIINRLCGVFLIVLGLLMATGRLNMFFAIFS